MLAMRIVGASLLAIVLASCSTTRETAEPIPDYQGLPDLVIRAFIPPVILAGEGDTIYVSDLVENTGTNVSGPTTVRYYISDQSPIEIAGAMFLGERSLRELKPGEAEESMEVPFEIPPGAGRPPLFLAACVDPDGLVVETRDYENCTTTGAGNLQFDSGALAPEGPSLTE